MPAQKIGFYSLRNTARLMCKYVYLFTPLIRAAYPNSTALLAALELANTACAALVEEIDATAPAGV